jgi:hypothetical protein
MKGINQLKENLLTKIPGRYDVYAVQYAKGYYPVTAPLDPKLYQDNATTIGAYLLDANNLVKLAIIDIDVNKEAYTKAPIATFTEILIKQTQQIASVLDTAGISYSTEYSGFKGYHLLIFFDKPVEAAVVRRKLHELEKDFVLVDDDLHWEIFPKQDKVPEGKYGNLIKLPLQKHQVSGKHSHFVDKEFKEILPTIFPINSIDVLETEPIKSEPEKVSFNGPIPHNIYRMELRCGYIRDAITAIDADKYLDHDTRVKLGSIYKNMGNKGLNRIHKHFSGLEDYEYAKTDKHLKSLTGNATTCEKMCGRNKCDAVKATRHESPIGFAFQVEADEIFEKRGRYAVKRYTRGGERNDRILTEWVIEPLQLVDLGEKDVLVCNIISSQGRVFRDIKLENESWHSRQKLLKALGHSELTFHGSDQDVQNLAQYITSRTLISKTGIDYIGLKDDVFVANGVNITNTCIDTNPSIELYIRGSENLADEYDLSRVCDDKEYLDVARPIYESLPKINDPETIYPLIGWNALAPIRDKIMDIIGVFPIGNVAGEAGSGKTASLEKFGMLNGAIDGTVHDCRITKFALLHLVSSTNGIPIILDEYKESTMDKPTVTAIKDILRGVYRGEVTKRGHADQSVSSYKLQAPVLISGEYKIDETAVRERSIHVGFKKKSLTNAAYVEAFKKVDAVDLGLFQPRYIQYLLGVDLPKYFDSARSHFAGDKTYKALNPRVQNNWLVLHVGLSVWYDYGVSLGLQPVAIPYSKIFETQAEELGYNTLGYMLRDVDKLMEHLANMAEHDLIQSGREFAIIDGKLLIHPKSILPALRKYSQSHNLDIFVMDESSFRTQLKDAEYFDLFDKKLVDGKQKRWAFLDIDKMKKAGLEIEGFGND